MNRVPLARAADPHGRSGRDAVASLLTVCLNPRQVLSASDGLKPGAGFALNSQ